MLYQLVEIEALSKHQDHLQQAKDKLNILLLDAHGAEAKVKNSLTQTISEILAEATNRVQIFDKIEQDALNGFLIPSYIDPQAFTRDKCELPEWTRAVLEKEFEKQKPSLDLGVRRLYSTQSVGEMRTRLERQVGVFRVLCDRYKVLSEHDQTIDIMREAEMLQNLTNLANQKVLSFLEMVASTLTYFVEEVTSKCQNLGLQLNTIASKSTNFNNSPSQGPPSYLTDPRSPALLDRHATGNSWLSRAHRNVPKKMAEGPYDYLLKEPRRPINFLSTYYR